jgi:N-acetyl-anhydromuramyl-L-alanine amidase AmpD
MKELDLEIFRIFPKARLTKKRLPMGQVINYDQPISDFIDQLSKTGHVTHKRYKKKSVTFHHNGMVGASHENILNIWRTRPASAHFDVDKHGSLAQYVEAHEYAWAVGNTQGNIETISFEMANHTAAPHWEVGEDTWRSAARLAAWCFKHIIKEEHPTRHNVFYHHHWTPTACPGPFMDSIYERVLAEVQHQYAWFMNHPHH